MNEKKTADLLPCPFCNSQPEWINEAVMDGHFYIRCPHCHIVFKEDRRDKVIGMWNTRQETAALREENELLKRSMKQGNEMYANLKFDDEPFTPYQLALQENERLKEALKKLIEVANDINALYFS